MAIQNQRGQILVESLFLVIMTCSLLFLFQIMIDQQNIQIEKKRISKKIKDKKYVKKNELPQ
jgi:hypothetical protein